MEARLRLGQIDQFLRNAFFPQRALDHFAIASAALQRVLQRFVTLGRGKIIDVARHLVGQHERQIRMRGLDLGFGLRLDVGVDRRRDLVDFINRRGLGFLLRRGVVRLQGRQFRTVYTFENALQFVLHSLVRANLGGTLQQQVKGMIKSPLGLPRSPALNLSSPSLVCPVGADNQSHHWIDFGRRLRLDLRGWSRLWIRRLRSRRGNRSQRRSVGLGSGQLGLALVGMAGRARQNQGQGKARSKA